LTRDGIACPSAHDPARNRHRDGAAWSKSAVRAILRNPRYTGRQVWNRQRREEVLVDVDDVALGHETRQRWKPESEWIWSAEPVHEPLITPELFAEAQRQNRAGRQRAVDRKPRTTRRPYALRRLLTCGLCGRKMQGSWNGGRAHYRCRYPTQYALANRVEHPKSVYVREDAVLPRLDAWLGVILDPATVDATVAALAAVDHDNTTRTEIERCERARADCEQRLARYRAALEAGTDPTIIAQWTSQVQAEQARAQRELRRAQEAHQPPPTRDELEQLISDAGDLVTILASADAADRAALYSGLGLRLRYQPDRRRVIVECRPDVERLGKRWCRRGGVWCRRGDLNPQVPKDTWSSTVAVASQASPPVPDCAAEQGLSTHVRLIHPRPSRTVPARMLPRMLPRREVRTHGFPAWRVGVSCSQA
jgi:hypothetical protein